MSPSSSPGSPGIYHVSPWQNKLREHCRNCGLKQPEWQMMSDKRGGRTAWSATVTVEGQSVAGRYWYDGEYSNNAKEDAAEVALQLLLRVRVVPFPILQQQNRGGYPSAQGYWPTRQ